MKEIHLISYCDDVQYEESSCVVLAVETKEQADKIVLELNQWLRATQDSLTKPNHYEEDSKFNADSDKRKAEVYALVFPYGIEHFRNEFEYNHVGTCSTYPVKLIESEK